MRDLTPYQDYVVLVRKFPKCLQEFTHPVQSAGQHFVSSITFVPLDKLMSGVINLGFLHSDLRITINTFLSRCMQRDKGLVQSVRLAAVGVIDCMQTKEHKFKKHEERYRHLGGLVHQSEESTEAKTQWLWAIGEMS